MGSITLAESPDKSAELYLAQHPYASAYAHFKDFNYWKLSVSDCRFVGGFGHMSWVEGENYSSSEADPFAQNAEHAIQHMNDDHADANLIFVQERGGLPKATEATMVGVDRLWDDLQRRNKRRASYKQSRFPRHRFRSITTRTICHQPFKVSS